MRNTNKIVDQFFKHKLKFKINLSYTLQIFLSYTLISLFALQVQNVKSFNKKQNLDLQVKITLRLQRDNQMQNKFDHSSSNFRFLVSALQVVIRTQEDQSRKNQCIRVLQKLNLPQSYLDVVKQLDKISRQKLFEVRLMTKLFRDAFEKITKNVSQYHRYQISNDKFFEFLLQIQKNICPSDFKHSYVRELLAKSKDFGWTEQFIADWIQAVDRQKEKRKEIAKKGMQKILQKDNQTLPASNNEIPNQSGNQNVQNNKPLVSSNQSMPLLQREQTLPPPQQNNSNSIIEEQNFSEEDYKKQTQEVVRLKQEYQKLSAQTFFYKNIRQNPDLKPNDVVFKDQQSSYFQAIFFKKLHQHKIEKLGKLIKKMNTPRIKTRKLPYTLYLREKRQSNKLTTVGYQNISEEFRRTETETNFSQDALELVHDNHNVDIDEFFKYDWSRFEVMSFNNCGLRTADLVKISRNALEMLPNLKHLYLNGNQIHTVRSNDFMKFVSIKKFELRNNKLDRNCESEIEKYLTERKDVIIEKS